MKITTALCSLLMACGVPPAESAPVSAIPPAEPASVAPTDVPTDEPAEASEPAAPPAAGPDAHRFERIGYPPVEGAFGPGSRLELDFFGSSLRVAAFGVAVDPFEGLDVQMHLADGTIIRPEEDPLANVFGGSRMQEPRMHWTRSAPFEWPGNTLDEAWVSIDLGAHGRYWLEIPYGCMRDPEAPLPSGQGRSRPVYARAMSELSERDHVVPFRYVRYDVGAIQDGWRLAVLVGNPFDPHVELELYRDDGGVGRSAYLWAMDEPTTSASFVAHGGGRVESMRTLTRLHEDGLRRSDHFNFFRRPHGQRGWGTLEVTIADTVQSLRVPSSLYLYTHGTADPYDEHRTVSADGVLGPLLF